MSGILDIIGGPVTALVNGAKTLIGQKLNNDHDKIEVASELGKLEIALQQAMLTANLQFVQAQQAVIVAEVQSESFLAKNWRPLAMLTFLGIIVYQGPLVSIFHWPPVDYSAIPDRLWSLLELGIGGYIGGRTVEKVVPKAIAAWKGSVGGAGNDEK